jgi:acyl-CoA synthetase (AMP-forming)/AMP-acid ligase II
MPQTGDSPGNEPLASGSANVAERLVTSARAWPDAPAVIVPAGRLKPELQHYRCHSFRELNDDSDCLARGLMRIGVTPGTRLALMVRPGFDFISLVFALFKVGAASILIDPGMGRRNVLRCLDEVEPQGFVAIPLVHAIRTLLRRRYPQARFNVTAGRRWFWGGATLRQFRAATGSGVNFAASDAQHDGKTRLAAKSTPDPFPPFPAISSSDPAAIIFTSGSTGPPKGVLYTHGNFARQVEEIRDFYGIQPGEIDVACFPLFALFNCAMGVTTVVPRMDFSRPAAVDPRNVIGPINDLGATQAFASPAVWDRVGRYCQRHSVRLPSLRRVLSAGAPVPAEVLGRMKTCIHPEGEVHTPYGATEALPVASITASEVLSQTAASTRVGGGTCVGRRFPGIEWKVIRIVEGPIGSLDECLSRRSELCHSERSEESPAAAETLRCTQGDSRCTQGDVIGELIVRGPVVTREYYGRPHSNVLGKIADGTTVWHRMGDVGYLDEQGRFWFCGRMAHRVLTADGPMYTIPCEAIFNCHEDVYRSALVGVAVPGTKPTTDEEHARSVQMPVIVVQPEEGRFPRTPKDRDRFVGELRKLAAANELTRSIEHFLIHPDFPVDIRHNAKIFREKLAAWAAKTVGL